MQSTLNNKMKIILLSFKYTINIYKKKYFFEFSKTTL